MVGSVVDGSPAQVAGLLAGDRTVSVDSQTISTWHDWVDTIVSHPETSMFLTLERQGVLEAVSITPSARSSETGEIFGYLGVTPEPVSYPDSQLFTTRYLPWNAVVKGVVDTYDMLTLSMGMLAKMVTGRSHLNN